MPGRDAGRPEDRAVDRRDGAGIAPLAVFVALLVADFVGVFVVVFVVPPALLDAVPAVEELEVARWPVAGRGRGAVGRRVVIATLPTHDLACSRRNGEHTPLRE